jgi:ferric-dicitrate binding protein FerR (iron transport regulator)
MVMIVRVSDDRTAVPAGTIVARVARISGPASEVDRAGVVGRVAVDDPVLVGESIATGDSGRLALRFADGTSLRLDVASRVTMIAPRVVELSSGAVYVDTADTSARFEVRTAMGTARDVGTQFEVRLVGDRLRVRVRSGVVELSDRTRTVTGHAETEILFSASEAESHSFSPYGPEWDWTAAAAPVIDMDGLTLSTYLERLARDRGWSVQYSDQALARDAGGIVLHGSVAGLATTEALAVAIGTSGLMYRLDNGRLMVFRETPR